MVQSDVIENEDFIRVYGAREHNLKNIDVAIPRNKLTVITGLSRRLRSTPSTPRVSAATSRLFRPMRASFWAVWTDQMWIKSQV